MLKNIRVLDLTQWLPGPFCTMLLSDLGAEVIKIERPGSGDPARKMLPSIFLAASRNKRSVTLDLKSQRGRELVLELAKQSEVLVEGFRPGVVARMGLDYESVQKVNPNIVYCSISGYGQGGPYRDRPGHDLNYLGSAGFLGFQVQIGQWPNRPPVPVGDLAGSMYAALSIVAALYNVKSGGTGQYLDVALAEALLPWVSTRYGEYLSTGQTPPPGHLMPTNDIFAGSDGHRFTVGVVEEHFWDYLCQAIDRHDLRHDPRFATFTARLSHGQELISILRDIFASRPTAEWLNRLEEAGVPWGPVNTPEQAFDDPHFVARDRVTRQGAARYVSYPVDFSDYRPPVTAETADTGAHTEEVLRALGLSAAEISTLRGQGII